MRIQDWYEFDQLHPVYERGEAENKWIAPLPGMKPAEYENKDGATVEPLGMEMAGYPSADIHKTDGGATVQQVRLNSKYAPDMDLSEVQELVKQWGLALESLSHGPYSLKLLKEMGHPYGYGGPPKFDPISWGRLKRPRAIPKMGKSAYPKGLRGRVSDQSVINNQSGDFAGSWFTRVLRWYGGVNLVFGNRAFYAWFLAHGTMYMQAHGPWEAVARRLLPGIHTAWRRAAYHAWRKQMRDAQRNTVSIDGDLGTGATTRVAEEFERGGFA